MFTIITALEWINTESVESVCRSLHIFRLLFTARTQQTLPTITQDFTVMLLSNLRKTMQTRYNDEDTHVSKELLQALECIVSQEDVSLFPQLMATIYIMLHTPSKTEFNAVCKLFLTALAHPRLANSNLLHSIQALLTPEHRWHLTCALSPCWLLPRPVYVDLVLKGLLNFETEKRTIQVDIIYWCY